MRRTSLFVVLAIALAASLAGLARAIEGGQPDTANAYAGVGLVQLYDAAGRSIGRCTGALISPAVVLTAGHCAGGDGVVAPARAQVWFESGYPTPVPRGPVGDVGGTPLAMPGWTGSLTFPNTHDLGVVVLDHPVSLPTYTVAPVGTLDALASKRGRQSTTFTIVGYGVQVQTPNLQVADRTRYFGDVQLVNLGNATADGSNLYTSGSPGNGTGGAATCYGDSGGPVFYDGRIVAVTSFGKKDCTGKAGAFRVDTVEAQVFLAGVS